jgi:hypothetical protein
MKKIHEVLDKKRNIGGARGAPICVALVPLSSTANVDFTLKYILANAKSFATVVGQSGNATYLK